MNKVSRGLCLLVALIFLVCAVASNLIAAPAKVTSDMRMQERVKKSEELKNKKEEADKAKREKKAQAEAKAKAKRDSRLKAAEESKDKAAKDAQTKAKYQQAKKQRDAVVKQAQKESKAKLAEVDAKAKKDTEKLAKELQSEKAGLKKKLDSGKVRATSEYKKSLAAAKKSKAADQLKKIRLDYDGKIEGLNATYMSDIAKVNKKMELHKEQVAMERQRILSAYDEKVAVEDLRLRLIKEQPGALTVNLPEDNTPQMDVKELKINGNILVPATVIYGNMPMIYNDSDMPLAKADSANLYDFRTIQDVIVNPGQSRKVSSRTIKGFTQYILSLYQDSDFAGIYVYVPKDAMASGTQLRDDVLAITVLEAPVTEVAVKIYDQNQKVTEKGYLKKSYVEKWSPIKTGEVTNQKEIDDFVNLLNENPDRYVSAVVTKGAEEKSLAVNYDIYEANPWHYFIQADDSGTKDRRWNPKVGLINTNLLGLDDTFTAIYQAPWEHGIEDQWSVYGSYNRPIWGPKLRLNLYAGYSQYDVISEGVADFIGNGSFVGGALRWNVLQQDGWFFDLLGTMDYLRSKTTTAILNTTIGTSNVRAAMWGWGAELYKSDDMTDTKFTFNVSESFDTSSQQTFEDARAGAETDFRIYTATAGHSRYLDPNKVSRLSGNFRWIDSSDRLVPAKMTTFGGLYTVRGYEESEFIADGGILASVQYEFDLVKYSDSQKPKEQQQAKKAGKNDLRLRKLAPLVFWDYGRAIINRSIADEKGIQDMCSFGAGALVELGNNFSGGAYYGIPTTNTDETDSGNGRWNFSVMYRW